MIPKDTRNYIMNGAANGERNQSLFEAACQMRDAGKDQRTHVSRTGGRP
ncbi:hypothetical protein OAF50_02990 [bacterium]|nr:hypothetical protein [bacterium]